MQVRKSSRRGKLAKRVFLVITLCVILVASVWAFRLMKSASKGSSMSEVWTGITNPRGLFPSKDRIIVLIAGRDYNRDKKGMPYSKDSRSDTIILLSADLEGKQLATVSIPRDTKVTGPDGVTHKINAMLQNGGIKALEDTVAREFGVAPDYYVVLKDTAVKSLVDAVGGVEVEAIDDMMYDDSWGGLHIDLKAGKQRVNGEQAVGFVRFRKMGTHKIEDGKKVPIPHKSSLEEGDLRRTQRQQQLIRALSTEAMKPGNLMKANAIVDTAFDQIDTNLTRPQVLALATLFKDRPIGNAPSATIPGTDGLDGGTYYYLPDHQRAIAMLQWLLMSDEGAGRSMVRVTVTNGSGVRGVAAKASDTLKSLGYNSSSGGNERQPTATSTVYFRKALFEPFARSIATQLSIKDIKKMESGADEDWRPEIKVVMGSDAAPTQAEPPAPR